MTKEIMSATGQPFTDPDAAQIKTDIMSRELGETFVVSAVPGGYVITLGEEEVQSPQVQIPVYPEHAPSTPPSNDLDTSPPF